jgi:hypothetical protein
MAMMALASFSAPSTSVIPETLFSRTKYLETDQQKGRQRPELLAARTVFREGIASGSSNINACTIARLGEEYRRAKKTPKVKPSQPG